MSYFINNDWGKNQYQNLSDVHSRQTARMRSIISTLIVGLCLALLILSLWNASQRQINTRVIALNPRKSLLHRTSPRFLSFGLDSSLLRDMKNFPIGNEKFINLARHLSPAYVRFGGTSADCLFFNQTLQTSSTKVTSPVDGQDISNFTINERDFLALTEFSRKSKLRMIFDLNVLIRRSDFSWDDSNAKDIIYYAKGHNVDLDWQLGNEPNSFRHVFERPVSAVQLARDYVQLRSLLNKCGYESSILVGPEVNHIGEVSRMGELYAKEFLQAGGDSISYVTWHQYYLNGREAQIQDFVNPKVFNSLPMQIKSVADVINASGRDIYMWLSETSTAYGGGAPDLSDRFVAGFLWLDKLGYSASAGVNVVTRQSLFGGNYAMVGPDLNPNPDWWVSVMYKQVVSEKVLRLETPDNFGTLRLYAHCTSENALISRVGAVTVYGVNLDKESVRITVQGIYPILNKGAKLFLYVLTSDHLKSRKIQINAETLRLRPNGDLPPFRPVILDISQTVVLPPYSMVFMVIHGVDIPACLT